jgi:hypothetical protein
LAAAPGFPQSTGQRHPDYKPDPRLEDIFRDLSAPLHSRLRRDRSRTAERGKEADASRGYSLEIGEPGLAVRLEASSADFHRFMSVAMGVDARSAGYAIRARIAAPEGCPAGASEAFHLRVEDAGCEITAGGADGIRRALVYLHDEMLARGGPILPLGPVSRWAVVEDRITRSPVAPYRFLSGWELEHDRDYYPDEYLNKLAHCGMNGVWVAGLLNRLVASKVLPELGPASHRLEKLKRLTERAARYGIKVDLFFIEPRALPPEHPVFVRHPETRGGQGRLDSLCVSSPLVQNYIREVMRELFTEVPELGGAINIFQGERQTTCWWNEEFAKTCPRCRNRSQGDVLADSLNSFMEGIRQANDTAKLIAWPYGGVRTTGMTSFLPNLHRDVIWMGTYDYGAEKTVHGKRVSINEYSLSSIEPSEIFVRVAREVIEGGRTAYAKLQIGNSHELATVPYIPVPQIAYDKVIKTSELKVKGSMISWITGGYPGPMLKAAGEAAFAPPRSREEVMSRTAAVYWGPGQADRVAGAWDQFSRAFQLYLFTTPIFLHGPITRCPSYQLHLEQEAQRALPYNWGISRSRVRQPYEDKVSRWTGAVLLEHVDDLHFTAEEMIASFREIGVEWNKGLRVLAECLRTQPNVLDLQ